MKMANSKVLCSTDANSIKGNGRGVAFNISPCMLSTYGIMAIMDKKLKANNVKYNFQFIIFLMFIKPLYPNNPPHQIILIQKIKSVMLDSNIKADTD